MWVQPHGIIVYLFLLEMTTATARIIFTHAWNMLWINVHHHIEAPMTKVQYGLCQYDTGGERAEETPLGVDEVLQIKILYGDGICKD
jgi:hypothetical protein